MSAPSRNSNPESIVRTSRIAISLALLACCLSLSAQVQQSSCQPQQFLPKDYQRQASAWSPDQSRRVQLRKNFKLRVESGGIAIGEFGLVDDPATTAIKWSSDSRSFYIEMSADTVGVQLVAYTVIGHTLLKLKGPEVVARELRKSIPASRAKTTSMSCVGGRFPALAFDA